MPAPDEPDGSSLTKAAARARFAAARRARPPADVAAARAAIAAHVLARAVTSGWRSVAAYEPLASEPGSVELLAELGKRGIEVLVPVTRPDRDLTWRVAGAADRGTLGLAAIGRVDGVLVPAFAVATDGTRLGRGGGSYDRALRRVRGGATVAALLFDEEVVGVLPADPWDVAVHAVVTPSGWRDLAG